MSKIISLQEYKTEKIEYAIITSKRIISYLEKIKERLNTEEIENSTQKEVLYLTEFFYRSKIESLRIYMSEVLKEIEEIEEVSIITK